MPLDVGDRWGEEGEIIAACEEDEAGERDSEGEDYEEEGVEEGVAL